MPKELHESLVAYMESRGKSLTIQVEAEIQLAWLNGFDEGLKAGKAIHEKAVNGLMRTLGVEDAVHDKAH